MNKLTKLEKDVLEMLLKGDLKILNSLRENLNVVKVIKREMTGAGFYTTFETIQTGTGCTCNLGDVDAEIPGLKYGATFILWIEKGELECLEGCSFGGEMWPKDTNDFKLSYSYDQRDFGDLELSC